MLRWKILIKGFYILLGSILLALSATGSWASDIGNGEPAEEEKSVGHYIYWDDGLRLTAPWLKLQLLWNIKVDGDAGFISAGEALQTAFPDLDGEHLRLRRADLALLGHWRDILQFKIQIGLAEVNDIKDNWVRFTGNRLLSHFTFGHMKEPFSLEKLTSSTYTTFMERSLATLAISPSRNVGITAAGTARSDRFTWAAGAFFNTESFDNQGEALDRISDAQGYDITGRITWLPQYENDGGRLFHLGMAYSHRFRNDSPQDQSAQFRSRPESYLTDDRLVDTGRLFNRGQDLINFEAAWLNGPLSLQAEFYYAFVDAAENLGFHGSYISASYVLTGEHRTYQRAGGIFTGIIPESEFRPFRGKWGALELALRLSAVNLNDKNIAGGRERNITVGLNWYLKRKLRLMVNYVHADVKDRANPDIEGSDADILMARLQFRF
jgi:phosphate-selective porin OprO/OprP